MMDIEDGIVERIGDPGMLERAAAAVTAARAAEIRVIYVKVGFRDGYPEVGPHNKALSARPESGQFVEGRSSTVHQFVEGRSSTVHQSVAPEPGETSSTSAG